MNFLPKCVKRKKNKLKIWVGTIGTLIASGTEKTKYELKLHILQKILQHFCLVTTPYLKRSLGYGVPSWGLVVRDTLRIKI